MEPGVFTTSEESSHVFPHGYSGACSILCQLWLRLNFHLVCHFFAFKLHNKVWIQLHDVFSLASMSQKQNNLVFKAKKAVGIYQTLFCSTFLAFSATQWTHAWRLFSVLATKWKDQTLALWPSKIKGLPYKIKTYLLLLTSSSICNSIEISVWWRLWSKFVFTRASAICCKCKCEGKCGGYHVCLRCTRVETDGNLVNLRGSGGSFVKDIGSGGQQSQHCPRTAKLPFFGPWVIALNPHLHQERCTMAQPVLWPQPTNRMKYEKYFSIYCPLGRVMF